MEHENELLKAIEALGGFEATGRVCSVSGKAVSKWAARKRLPRTEATGETNYAQLIAKACPGISKKRLLETVYRKG